LANSVVIGDGDCTVAAAAAAAAEAVRFDKTDYDANNPSTRAHDAADDRHSPPIMTRRDDACASAAVSVISDTEKTYASYKLAHFTESVGCTLAASFNTTDSRENQRTCVYNARLPPFRNRSSVEIGSSSIFPLFRSIAGQPIIDADEPQRQRQRCTEKATANGNGETATE